MTRDERYYTLINTEHCMLRRWCQDFGNKYVCNMHCQRGDNMNYFLAVSELPRKYCALPYLEIKEIENPDTRSFLEYMFYNIDRFVDEGYQAYFFGPTGTGKTAWAAMALAQYLKKVSKDGMHRVPGVFVAVPELLRKLKYYTGRVNTWLDAFIDDIKNCPIVVWDDLTLTDLTPFELQFLYSIINERIDNCRCNIYTNVTTPKELFMSCSRLYSKVCENSSCIEFTGKSMRGTYTFTDLIRESEEILREQEKETAVVTEDTNAEAQETNDERCD